jgi:hypothetical protein
MGSTIYLERQEEELCSSKPIGTLVAAIMTSAYDPSLGDFCDILKDYALSGISFWHTLGGKRQTEVARLFGPLIENDPQQLEWKFSEAKKERAPQFNFIPMPEPSGRDFVISFFVPRFDFSSGKKFRCGFLLVAWINHNGGRTVAFRFEAAHGDNTSHAYDHLQLTRIMNSPDHTSSFEKWIPQSYPAFPFVLANPLEFFATIAVAVHGYSRKHKAHYVAKTVSSAMQDGNAALRGRRVVEEINRLFG